MSSTFGRGDRPQLVHGSVEPLPGEHEAHVGQLSRRLDERDLALLNQRRLVDRPHREGLAAFVAGGTPERVGHTVVDDRHTLGRDRGVLFDLPQAVLGVGDQPPGTAHDPAARAAAEPAALVAVADLGHVRGVKAADHEHRWPAQQPGQRDREEGVPGGKPAEHQIGPQYTADEFQRVGEAAGLVEVLHVVTLGQDRPVDLHEARPAAVGVEDAGHAATGSRASTNAACHSDSSSRQ